MNRGVNGLLLIDKPSGPTSHDIINRVRRIAGQRRVGHAGTLDPMASGLLPVVLGVATRLVRFLPHSPKVYGGVIRLGRTTDSDDVTGETIERHAGELPDEAAVVESAAGFVGRSLQQPPAVSARKVGGERMYRLARQGVRVEAESREIEVFSFELEPTAKAGDYRFIASVTGGTYIRALARDLGRKLGCGGTLAQLRRIAIGPMTLDSAVILPEAAGEGPDDPLERLISPAEMPLDPPPIQLIDPLEARRFAQGAAVRLPDEPVEGYCRVYSPSGRLLGVAESDGTLAQPRVIVSSADQVD